MKMRTSKSGRLKVSVLSVSMAVASTMAVAESDHHQGGEDGGTQFVENTGMGGMDSMGGGMQMMRPMMQMHVSMMSQMAMNGQIGALFKNTDPTAAIADFDTNGDAMIDLDEYAAWEAQALRFMTVDRFQSLDADGTGDVTLEELQTASKNGAGMGHMNGMGSMGDDMGKDDPSDG